LRAVVCREFGPPESLSVEEMPLPAPSDDEILVEVHAAAVNFPDLLIIQNKYQISLEPPFIPGSELAGVVRRVGSRVTTVKPGDFVFGQTIVGAFAEHVTIPARTATVVPPETDLQAAAAFGVVFSTAYNALRSFARLEEGETVLILGAAGGIGLAALQVARLLGARVIAAASSEEKLAVCKEYGVSATIDYRVENLKDRVKSLTSGKGVDAVIDPVGGPNAELAVRATGWRGRYVSVGFASGEIPRIPLNLLLLKGCELHAFNIATFLHNEPEEAERNRRELLDLFASGKLRPHVCSVYPLAETGRALLELAERRAIGKVVIDPRVVA
jgi:NADPH:quinone reductase